MKRILTFQLIALLTVIFTIQTAFTQLKPDDTAHTTTIRSEGGGNTSDEAIHNARTKAVLSQVDTLARLKSSTRGRIHQQISKAIDPFIRTYKVISASDEGGVHRAVLDVELDTAALVEKLVKLDVTEDFRYKPRVMIAILEKDDGEISDTLSLTTELGTLLLSTGFKVVAPTAIGEVRNELIKGVSPERLAAVAAEHKVDILIRGEVDTKEGRRSSLLKNADLQPYTISGSIRAVHCETGELYFSKNFSQNQPSTSLENALQTGLKQLLRPGNTRGIAKPLLTGILQPWSIQVATGVSTSIPDLGASAPPTILMRSPENLTVTGQDSILLRAVVTDDKAVDGIKLWVNGVEIATKDDEHLIGVETKNRKQGADDNAGEASYQIHRLITLASGENRIRLVAYDSDANETEQGLTIIRNSASKAADIQLTLLSPANESVVGTPFTLLKGEASSPDGIVDVKIFANGIELPVARDLNMVRKVRKEVPAYQIDRRVPLQSGRNLIRLVAQTTSGKRHETSVVVNRSATQYNDLEEASAEMPAYARETDIQIDISEPANGSTVDAPVVKLSGEARGKARIVSVNVAVNGVELPMSRDLNMVRKPPKAVNQEPPYELSHHLPLRIGRNAVKITATASDGNSISKYVIIDRVGADTRIGKIKPQLAKPQIAMYEPNDGLKTTDASIRLRGEIFGEQLSSVTVSLNDNTLIRQSAPFESNGTFPLQKEMALEMGENRIRIHAQMASGGKLDETYTVTRIAPDTMPPFVINIESPTPGAEIAQESVHLLGTITGSSEVADVEVQVNRVQSRDLTLAHKTKRKASPRQIDEVLYLAPGENKITVNVQGKSGEQETRVFTVNRVLETSTRDADDAPDDTYQKYALIIGIGNYQDPQIPDLTYARTDAESIYNKLIKLNGGGFPQKNVQTLFDEQASLKNIKAAISKLAKTVNPNDMVFMYYSGHGGVTPDLTGEESDGRQKYIIPHDADLANLDTTGLRNSELSLLLDRIPANKFVFVIDCCFSGGQVSDGTLKSVSPANTAIGTDVYGQLSSAGRVVISASQSNQVSFETAGLGHGIFTHHLLEALDGKADFDTNRLVNLLETYMYVQREVAMTARQFGQVQQPKFMGNISGTIVLVRLGN
jgi:uncharacterized caspase-like protein